jgi:hypothetical protein
VNWISWPHHAYLAVRIDPPPFQLRKINLAKSIASKIDDKGELFGLPPDHTGYRQFPDPPRPSATKFWEGEIGNKFLDVILDCIITEGTAKVRELIQEEGIVVLKAIAEGERNVFSDDG